MVSVTLKTHSSTLQPVGFVRQSLTVPYIRYDDNLAGIMDNLNQYRIGDAQITRLYNAYGQEIPVSMWSKIKIREHLTFYIDQPSKAT